MDSVGNSVDAKWAEVARGSRQALIELGYGVPPACLPDEAEACGGTWAQHAMANLGALKAVADHHLKHLGELGQMHGEVYWRTRKALEADCKGPH